jgi:hypothetical protein
MDLVIFTGQMDLEEFQEDKPEEYETLVANGTLDRHLAPPYPPVVIRTIRIFATAAVLLGFSMIVWIIYAMIFAYR